MQQLLGVDKSVSSSKITMIECFRCVIDFTTCGSSLLWKTAYRYSVYKKIFTLQKKLWPVSLLVMDRKQSCHHFGRKINITVSQIVSVIFELYDQRNARVVCRDRKKHCRKISLEIIFQIFLMFFR